jgi:hypothetical protein
MPKIHARLEENICFKMVTALKRQCCFGSVFKYQFISVRVIEDQYNIECLQKRTILHQMTVVHTVTKTQWQMKIQISAVTLIWHSTLIIMMLTLGINMSSSLVKMYQNVENEDGS